MIELDGAHLEGGGALVRVALALSTLTGKEFKVINIRSSRPNPGLKAQHLTAINALKQICGAETNEIKLGSTELEFKPGKIKKGIYEIDIGTAGSITLLLQALILPCLFSSGKITFKITGGTCGKWQAPVDYLQNILLPHLQKFVEKIDLKILKRGYFPKGKGLISLEINPRFKLEEFENFESFYEELQFKVAKIKLDEQGTLEQIKGLVDVSIELADKEVAERIKKFAENSLKKIETPINIGTEYVQSSSIGGNFLLWAIFGKDGKIDFDNPVILGSDALIELGKKSEEVSKEAVEKLKQEISSKATVDHNLADQLIPFMALLPKSEILTSFVSEHTKTNIYVVEKFLPVGYSIKEKKIKVNLQ